MATVIYQLSHLHGKPEFHIDMQHYCYNMLTFWHFDISQPKRDFCLLAIRGAVIHALVYHSLGIYCTASKLGDAY